MKGNYSNKYESFMDRVRNHLEKEIEASARPSDLRRNARILAHDAEKLNYVEPTKEKVRTCQINYGPTYLGDKLGIETIPTNEGGWLNK